MKEVLIEIKGKQTVDGDSDTIELTTVGKMDTVGDKTYIRYDDSAATATDSVACMIKYDPKENSVIMQRSGTLNSRMYIKKGQRHICHYETGQGVLTMGIFGENVDAKLNTNGGRLKLSYTIDVNYGLMSRNEVEINVKEV
jgi:uncharacterized beta-barrel protein YwiB (DUF1934 family)